MTDREYNEIVITYDPKRGFNAFFKNGSVELQGWGRSKKEALGDLLVNTTNFKITDWCYTPYHFIEDEPKELSKVL